MRTRIALLVLPLLAGCVAAPADLVESGERLLGQKQYVEAAKAFKDALASSSITQLEREKAEVGEARAFLGKGDVVGAETRLRRMSDQRSAKWYCLGEVALARKDRLAATQAFRKAMERTHGGDTATRLAGLIAGEARKWQAFAEAGKVLESGGQAADAKALREAARVWRALLAGKDANELLARLGAHEAALAPYPAAQVLEARLLDRAGKSEEAAAAWDLSSFAPPPSPKYQQYAKALRARLAIERGDEDSLNTVLEGADAKTAGRVRGELARSRLWRGDVQGALDLWRKTAEAGGEPAPLAWAQLAQELERLGRSDPAQDAWTRARKTLPQGRSLRLRLLVAEHRTREGDLLGACATLQPSDRDVDDRSDLERTRADNLRWAGDMLRTALAAHEAGDDERRDRFSRAVLLLVPLEPVALQLGGRAVDGVPDPSGSALIELRRAILVRHLRRGELDEAKEIVRWWKVRELDGALTKAELARLDGSLQAELHGALRAALRLGRQSQVKGILGATELSAACLADLRACACLASQADLGDSPRGVAALGDGEHWGSLVVPSAGLRLALTKLTRAGPRWTLTLPGGGVLDSSSRAAFEAALGAPVSDMEWTSTHGAGDPAGDARRTWRSGHAPWPTVEVQ